MLHWQLIILKVCTWNIRWFSGLCSPLYDILLDYNIIHSSYTHEAQLSMCLDRYSPKVRWYSANHCEGLCVCFQERYCKVCSVVHENVRTPHKSSNSFCRDVWWLDLQFHLKALTTTVRSLWTTKYCTFILYGPCIFPSHLSSLLALLKKYRDKSQNRFLIENKCM